MSGAQVLGPDGRFAKAELGSEWFLRSRTMTLTGIVVWSVRPEGANHEDRMAIAALRAADAPAMLDELIVLDGERWLGGGEPRVLADAPPEQHSMTRRLGRQLAISFGLSLAVLVLLIVFL